MNFCSLIRGKKLFISNKSYTVEELEQNGACVDEQPRGNSAPSTSSIRHLKRAFSFSNIIEKSKNPRQLRRTRPRILRPRPPLLRPRPPLLRTRPQLHRPKWISLKDRWRPTHSRLGRKPVVSGRDRHRVGQFRVFDSCKLFASGCPGMWSSFGPSRWYMTCYL